MKLGAGARIALVVLGLILLIALLTLSESRARQESTSSFSDRGVGSSIFFELASELRANSVTVSRRPFTDAIDPARFRAVYVLAPKLPISEREAGILDRYVRAGGTLVLSVESLDSLDTMQELLHALEAPPLQENKAFKNFETAPIGAARLAQLGLDKVELEFYSQTCFEAHDCDLGDADTFVSITPRGQGRLVYFSGLPPFANSMIARAENRRLAFRLLELYPDILVDEYHHFFIERGWRDLVADYSMSLPLLGLIVAGIVFFLFGSTNIDEDPDRDLQEQRSESFHALSQDILAALLRKSPSLADGVEKQAGVIRKMHPALEKQVDAVMRERGAGGDQLGIARSLVQVHQKYLKTRRGV